MRRSSSSWCEIYCVERCLNPFSSRCRACACARVCEHCILRWEARTKSMLSRVLWVLFYACSAGSIHVPAAPASCRIGFPAAGPLLYDLGVQMLEDDGEVVGAHVRRRQRPVERGGALAQRQRVYADALALAECELQVLAHEVHAEAPGIALGRGNGLIEPWAGRVGIDAPATRRGCTHDTGHHLRLDAEARGEAERLARADHLDGEGEVVAELRGGPGAGAAAAHNVLAHHL
mmetsp:Transcript_9143/g.26695  ORF Transcript_9143/g.26695 Transcript_9143/m.26695 type:complete len:233 (+) Transcript_9143:690-1388(+)